MKYYVNIMRCDKGTMDALPPVKSEWEAIEQAANELVVSPEFEYVHTICNYGILIKVLDLESIVNTRAIQMAKSVDEILYPPADPKPKAEVIDFPKGRKNG